MTPTRPFLLPCALALLLLSSTHLVAGANNETDAPTDFPEGMEPTELPTVSLLPSMAPTIIDDGINTTESNSTNITTTTSANSTMGTEATNSSSTESPEKSMNETSTNSTGAGSNSTTSNTTSSNTTASNTNSSTQIFEQATTTNADSSSSSSSSSNDTIIDVAVANNLTTLLTAAQAAELEGVLSSGILGTLTFLAPTNEAFAKLPNGTWDILLEPENRDTLLTSVLSYHAILGNVTSDMLFDGMSIQTFQGENVTVSIASDGSIMFNNAKVLQADIFASNGVLHIIDRVLVPEVVVSALSGNTNSSGNMTSSPTIATISSPAPSPIVSSNTTLAPILTDEELCVTTGGNVTNSTCCGGTAPFANQCNVEICPCPGGGNAEDVTICSCPEGSCFHPDAGCISDEDANKIDLCESTGGMVTHVACCADTGNFPPSCGIIGPCGCPPDSSELKLVCDCPIMSCFNETNGCIQETQMPTFLSEPTSSPAPMAMPTTMPISMNLTNTTDNTTAPTAAPTESMGGGNGTVSIEEMIAANSWMTVGNNRDANKRDAGITAKEEIDIFNGVAFSGAYYQDIFDERGPFADCYDLYGSSALPLAIPCATTLYLSQVKQSRFTSRARTMVQESEENSPYVVTLQDIVTITRNTTVYDALTTNDLFSEANRESLFSMVMNDVFVDQPDILKKEFRRRCQVYQFFLGVSHESRIPAMVNTSDVTQGFQVYTIRKYNVIMLKKQSVSAWRDGRSIRYVQSEAVGSYIYTHGALSVDVDINGATFRVVTTQLSDTMQEEQGAELVEYLSRLEDGTQTFIAGYIPPLAARIISAAGYNDGWTSNTNRNEVGSSEAVTATETGRFDIRDKLRPLAARSDLVMVQDGNNRWQSNQGETTGVWAVRMGLGGIRGKVLGRPRWWASTNAWLYSQFYPVAKTNIFRGEF